ncbi:hypothetical protein NDU88_005262 [Pleurodeles waltl]|uniref:Uncharacterized protein n=1 Tax=Pleurodeles waltl TaxID=8319 RepID=A0AAV7TAB1_PLEWA|nr:hypothetical protein NDU88_005262 [Pleurodeles waltl]
MKVVIRGLCMQTTYGVWHQLEQDVLDHEAKLRDSEKCLPTQPQRMEEWRQTRQLLLDDWNDMFIGHTASVCMQRAIRGAPLEAGVAFLDGVPLPRLTARALLDAPLNQEEIQGAIKQLKTSKTPGFDGLPAEFYQKYDDILSEKMLAVYQEAPTSGCLSDSMREAWVAFIPKPDRDPTDPTAYRPLLLLNVVIKIESSVLIQNWQAVRMKHVRTDPKLADDIMAWAQMMQDLKAPNNPPRKVGED